MFYINCKRVPQTSCVTCVKHEGWYYINIPQNRQSCVGRDGLNFSFKVKDEMNLDNRLLTIMWTHIANTNLKMWTPNHFVPCIVKRHLQRKLSLFSLGQKRVHRTSFRTVRRKKLQRKAQQSRKRKILQAKKRGKKAKSVKLKNMALLLASFFHNSLIQNIFIYLVDIWHYAIY